VLIIKGIKEVKLKNVLIVVKDIEKVKAVLLIGTLQNNLVD